jgi:hypothetical protein
VAEEEFGPTELDPPQLRGLYHDEPLLLPTTAGLSIPAGESSGVSVITGSGEGAADGGADVAAVGVDVDGDDDGLELLDDHGAYQEALRIVMDAGLESTEQGSHETPLQFASCSRLVRQGDAEGAIRPRMVESYYRNKISIVASALGGRRGERRLWRLFFAYARCMESKRLMYYAGQVKACDEPVSNHWIVILMIAARLCARGTRAGALWWEAWLSSGHLSWSSRFEKHK